MGGMLVLVLCLLYWSGCCADESVCVGALLGFEVTGR